MSFFVKSLEEITFQAVHDLVYKDQQEESVLLDYKSGVNPKMLKEDIAKDVSSFANHYGGVLIYGVEEKGGKPVEICGIADANVLKDQIVKVSASPHVLQPPIFLGDPVVCSGEIGGKTCDVVVVKIGASDAVPHFFRGSTTFYVRCADTNQPIKGSCDILELLQNRREKSEQMKARLFQEAKELSSHYFKDTHGRLKTSIDQIQVPRFLMCLQPKTFDYSAISAGSLRESLRIASDTLRKRYDLPADSYDNFCEENNSESYSSTVVFKWNEKPDALHTDSRPNVSWTSAGASGMLYHLEDMPLEKEPPIENQQISTRPHAFVIHLVLRRIYGFLLFAREYYQICKRNFALDFRIEFYQTREMQVLHYETVVKGRRVIENHFPITKSFTTYELEEDTFVDN